MSASVGAGHVRAAQALEKAFIELKAARQVRHIDALQYTNPLFRRLYSNAYIEIVNKAPELYGWFYGHFDKPWQNERRRMALDKLNTRPFVKMLEEYQPDVAVCTHFLPAEIISWLKEKHRIITRQAIVVTDFDLHAFWLCHHYEHYFVALEETKAHLEELGVPAGKITVSGIPIDPVFTRIKDKTKMRLQHNLMPDLPTILVSAGGFGVGPVEKLVQSLLKMRKNAQVVVICGKNEELKKSVARFIHTTPEDLPVHIFSIGYTTEMDEYMSAADIILGKTGGLTTSEALAKGLAFVIVDPIPGQEQRNAFHLLEEGAAIQCNNWPVLAYKIDKLLDNRKRLTSLEGNSLRLSRPAAAYDIVRSLISL